MELFVSECKKSIDEKNGNKLGQLLIISNNDNLINKEIIKFISNNNNLNINQISQLCMNMINNEQLYIMVYNKILILNNIYKNNYSTAIDDSLIMYNSLLDYLKEDNNYWILPVLVKLSNEIRLLAIIVIIIILKLYILINILIY